MTLCLAPGDMLGMQIRGALLSVWLGHCELVVSADDLQVDNALDLLSL